MVWGQKGGRVRLQSIVARLGDIYTPGVFGLTLAWKRRSLFRARVRGRWIQMFTILVPSSWARVCLTVRFTEIPIPVLRRRTGMKGCVLHSGSG